MGAKSTYQVLAEQKSRHEVLVRIDCKILDGCLESMRGRIVTKFTFRLIPVGPKRPTVMSCQEPGVTSGLFDITSLCS